MTDREKLIELLREVQYLGGLEEKIADHLIANGIIVLPCKVGDTVYIIRECSCYNDPNVSRRYREKCAERVYLGNSVKKCTHCGYVSETKLDLKHLADLGKNVFLTKEDAEAELSRRKENDYGYL